MKIEKHLIKSNSVVILNLKVNLDDPKEGEWWKTLSDACDKIKQALGVKFVLIVPSSNENSIQILEKEKI